MKTLSDPDYIRNSFRWIVFLKNEFAIFCILSKEDLIVKFNYVNFQHKKILCIQIKDE